MARASNSNCIGSCFENERGQVYEVTGFDGQEVIFLVKRSSDETGGRRVKASIEQFAGKVIRQVR